MAGGRLAGAAAEDGAGLDRASAAGGGALAAVPSAITATTAPTGATSPAGTRISVSTPAVVDGTSIDTLSVSISNRLSPGLMASPADLNHCVILPSATVSPSCGIKTSIALIPRAPTFGFENSSKLNYITATFSVAPQATNIQQASPARRRHSHCETECDRMSVLPAAFSNRACIRGIRCALCLLRSGQTIRVLMSNAALSV